MAQLVEHIVHIDGVTGSSPVATTTALENTEFSRVFLCRDNPFLPRMAEKPGTLLSSSKTQKTVHSFFWGYNFVF